MNTDSLDRLTGVASGEEHPRGITQHGSGGKFTPQGSPLPFCGNTFICHLDQNSKEHYALRQLQEGIRTGPASSYFAYVPPSSFHMTIFQGACNSPLERKDNWPKDTSEKVTLENITEVFQVGLKYLEVFDHVIVKPMDLWDGHWIPLTGSNKIENKKLWSARKKLQNHTKIYRKDFFEYCFHITIVYQTRWMSRPISVAHLNHSERLYRIFSQNVAKLEFNQIELCTFRNMLDYKIKDYAK